LEILANQTTLSAIHTERHMLGTKRQKKTRINSATVEFILPSGFWEKDWNVKWQDIPQQTMKTYGIMSCDLKGD
jgi:hypothetical protein